MFNEQFLQALAQERPAPREEEQGTEISYLSRRRFLQGSSLFAIGLTFHPGTFAAEEKPKADSLAGVQGGDASPSLWISIDTDNRVNITCHRSEMGQQTWTAMAQIVAEELEADWEQVNIVQAEGHPRYGDQNTDGSRSVRFNFHRLRMAGAAMALMLRQAAAKQWNVNIDQCIAQDNFVSKKDSRSRLPYSVLAKLAAKRELPKASEIKLKARENWRYIGKPKPSLTVPKIVRGQGTFGIDVQRPNQLIAVVARPPQVFGKTKSYNDEATRKTPGVLKVLRLPDASAPAMFKALGGVAVVAKDTWSAIQGRKALKVVWEDGPNKDYDTSAYEKQLTKTAQAKGDTRYEFGDVDAGLKAAKKRVTADYYAAHLTHSPMEPPAATAEWTGGKLECWACVQDPQTTRKTLAGILGIDIENITVTPTWLGGAFGRKSKCDFVVEAALIAKEMGKPVKVVWTREDDIQHGYYHSNSAQHFEAGLDDKGNCTAYLHRSVFPTISSTFSTEAKSPSAGELGLGASDNPFEVKNFRLETGKAESHLRIGWLRSVSNIFHTFGNSSFVDELAAAAGKDPKDYLLQLIGSDRKVDPNKWSKEQYGNYSASLDTYPIETKRLKAVINKAAEMANWGRSLPKGHGLGIAAHRSFLAYVATVVEVKVDSDGRLTIPKVWLAVDAGTIVNPTHVKAQMEGGTLYGFSNALYGEITAKNGQVEQSNFPNWRVMRMHEAPQDFEVHIVESDGPPCGVGEPATPPAAPALTNAIFAATGKRFRRLPLLGAQGERLKI